MGGTGCRDIIDYAIDTGGTPLSKTVLHGIASSTSPELILHFGPLLQDPRMNLVDALRCARFAINAAHASTATLAMLLTWISHQTFWHSDTTAVSRRRIVTAMAAVAAQRGNLPVLEWLLGAGACVLGPGLTMATQHSCWECECGEDGCNPICKELVSSFSLDEEQEEEEPPLHHAISYGQLHVAQWLRSTPSRAVMHPFDKASIYLASIAGHTHVVEWLLSLGDAVCPFDQANAKCCVRAALREGYTEPARLLPHQRSD